MSTPEIIALVLQGGAVVVLCWWIIDLKDQRKYQDKLREQERQERIANAEVMRTVGQSLGALTNSIEALINGDPPRPPRSRR